MASFVLDDVEVRFSGKELTTLLNSVTLSYGSDVQDGTTFGAQGTRKRLTGLKESSATLNGFFDNADESDEDFFNQMGAVVSAPVSFVPRSGLVGDVVYFLDTHESTWNPGGNIGELMGFSAEFQSAGPLVRGTILESGIISVSGVSTEFQLGALATSLERMFALVHVLAVSGAGPTLDLVIESDDAMGFASPTTRITFPQFTDVGSEVLFVNGPITDDWWRAAWTIGGTTPTFDVFVAIGKLGA